MPGTPYDLLPMRARANLASHFRLHAAGQLQGWGLEDTEGDLALVLSELVANAVAAAEAEHEGSHAAMVCVRVTRPYEDGVVRVEVFDNGTGGHPHIPVQLSDTEDGRGLYVVSELAGGRWGWTTSGLPAPWKCVWAEVTVVPAAVTVTA